MAHFISSAVVVFLGLVLVSMFLFVGKYRVASMLDD